MTKIVEILKKETKSLKTQYVEMTEKWAKKEFNRLLDSNCDGNAILVRGKYYPKNNSLKQSETAKINLLNLGKDIFLKKSVDSAKEHYENSILKLADRISKKGLNIDKLKVETSHIGVNIETTLTDGKKTVNAFTIIASGEIQRPHYRYLIK